MKTVKTTIRTEQELATMNRESLIAILKEELNTTEAISRTKKEDLISMILDKQPKIEIKVSKKREACDINKSDVLRKEIRRRIKANQTLNSGDLIEFMKSNYQIEMRRQFIVNVRNRYLTANPELLKA